MAILRLSKEINHVKTATATTVVRWWAGAQQPSSFPSSMTTSPNTIQNENDDDDNSHYWMYEIPDNESQVTASAVKAVSACYEHTYRIWDSTDATTSRKSSSMGGSDAVVWDQNHHHSLGWYQPPQQCPCSDQTQNYTLLYRILYWCKQIILKVGRSYYALPVALLLLTLSLGILMGYIIGYRHGRNRDHQKHQPQQEHRSKQMSTIYTGTILPLLIRLFMSVWNRSRRFSIRRQKLKSQDSLEMRDSSNHEQWNGSSMQCSNRLEIDQVPTRTNNNSCSNSTDADHKEQIARVELKSEDETQCESGLSRQELPKHIAVVMDGNRRYGLQQYNDPVLGHWDGSKKLVQFVKWCVAEHIQELTVYAFSTENWSRSAHEVSALMNIIIKHCEELRIEAMAKQISIHIKSTDTESIPVSVRDVLLQLEKDTYQNYPTLRVNICLSYGSRGEIVQACRSIVTEYQNGNWTSLLQVTEESITQKLLLGSSLLSSSSSTTTATNHNDTAVIHNNHHHHHHHHHQSSHPPDIFIRTSGEIRLSNFLLWQMAYTELFFLQKNWPELNKDDFLNVLRSYVHGRQRRFGR